MIAEKPGATAQKLAPPLMGRMVASWELVASEKFQK
jgi:hypothetical protein